MDPSPDGEAAARRWLIDELATRVPVVLDRRVVVSDPFDVARAPAMVLIDASRQIAWESRSIDAAALETLKTTIPRLGSPPDPAADGADPKIVDAGRPKLLVFMATWCSACKRAGPSLRKIARRYRKRGLHTVVIASDRGAREERKLRQWVHTRIDAGIEVQPDTGMKRFHGVRSIPSYVVLDRGGEVVGTVKGYTPARMRKLEQFLRRAVARR